LETTKLISTVKTHELTEPNRLTTRAGLDNLIKLFQINLFHKHFGTPHAMTKQDFSSFSVYVSVRE